MLQLPHKPISDVMKSGPLKGIPMACAETCEAYALALRYEKLVIGYKNATNDERHDRYWTQMQVIAEKASWISPRSVQGATFQAMLAAFSVETANASTNIKRCDLARAHRLLYRAMDYYGDFSAVDRHVTGEWLMPEEKDQKKPRRTGRAR